MMYKVTEVGTGKVLTDFEILKEINTDRSHQWTDFTVDDLKEAPEDVLCWIDPQIFKVETDNE